MSPMSFPREVASVLLKVLAVILTIAILGGWVVFLSSSVTSISDGACNIAVMPVEGVIMPFGNGFQYGEFVVTPRDVREFLAALEQETMIEGVVFDINSPGGAPVASEAIAELIDRTTLPNVALIGDMAASGGYMAAAAADVVFASAMSDVGSIGVTASYLEESEKNEEEGITYVPLNSGEFKDMGSPYKPITDAERTKIEAQLKEIHDHFISLVSTYRDIDEESVRALADGSTMTGTKALESMLIDEIGGREKTRDYFASVLNKPREDIIFCEYAPMPLL